ncbi:hypothetical protein ACTXT7_007034 [Hymenolepis weldensis]
MADLLHTTGITMLLREFNRSDNYLCSSYFQPMDPYEKVMSKLGSVVGDNSSLFNLTINEDEIVNQYVGVVNRLCTSFRFGSLEENQFKCLIFNLGVRSLCHAEIRFRRSENDLHLSTEGTLSPSNNYTTNIRNSHSQDANFAENVVIIKTTLSKTSLPELQQQWPRRRLLPRIFYKQSNEAEPEQQESINSDKEELWSTLAPISNAVQLYVSMRCETIFLKKTTFWECYITDRNINLMGQDWIDELNLIQFPDENETCQKPTLEPANAEDLVRECTQCLHVAEVPHPSIYIQLPKPDSPRTQL